MFTRLKGLALLVSMCIFPGTWVEAYGIEAFNRGIDILKNFVLA